jgi:hypothetical protein
MLASGVGFVPTYTPKSRQAGFLFFKKAAHKFRLCEML